MRNHTFDMHNKMLKIILNLFISVNSVLFFFFSLVFGTTNYKTMKSSLTILQELQNAK